ncbi:MAG: hypothetical protein K2K90_18930 [Lachnospiraceae bacterium]|nr:hypothetical protein [Lachnospiraceae bacterium]
MRKNRIRAGILSFALILLSACATTESGGTMEQNSDSGLSEGQSFSADFETMPEETVSGVNQETASESGGESDRTESVLNQETLGEQDSNVGGKLVSSEKEESSEPEISLAAYREAVEKSEIGTAFCLVDSMTTAELTYF